MREYGLTLLVTAAVTYLLTPLVRRVALRFKVVIPARERDVHAGPIPRIGGVAMYLGVAAGLLAAYEMLPLRDAFPRSGLVLGLLGAGGVIVVIGIIDDRWGMSAIGKLAGQVVAAGILFKSGAQLNSFPEPNNHLFSLTQNESVVLTILVVVATINAVNFIDGLDGLAAGIVFIAASSFFVYYYTLAKVVGLSAEAIPALASVVLAGACLGFLPHNFYPARIFMGDTGAMLLGLMLAYVPIWAIDSLDYTSLASKANRYPEILPLLLPAAVLVIPYVDLLRAVFRRTKAGKSPFSPDNKHLHHRLLEIGHTHRASVLILYAWALVFSGTVVGLSLVTAPLKVLAGTTLAAVLVLALLSLPKLRWWERSRGPQAAMAPAPAGQAVGQQGFGPAAAAGPGPRAADHGFARPSAASPDLTTPDLFGSGVPAPAHSRPGLFGGRTADHRVGGHAAGGHQPRRADPALTSPDLYRVERPDDQAGHRPADEGAPQRGGNVQQAWQPKPEPRPWPWQPSPDWPGQAGADAPAGRGSPWPEEPADPGSPWPAAPAGAAPVLPLDAARASGNVIP